MTTLAFRAGILAADTMISSGNLINIPTSCKIIASGDILAGAFGNLGTAQAFLRWAAIPKHWEDLPEFPDWRDKDDAGIVIFRIQDGYRYLYFHKDAALAQMTLGPNDYIAEGSGADLAMGAMFHGATAEQAIASAIRHDKNTGGTVQTVKLGK